MNEEIENLEPIIVEKLILLETDEILIGKVIMNHEHNESLVLIYRPVAIIQDNDGTTLRPWIPESKDDVFFIPLTKILNVSNPKDDYVKAYHKAFFETTIENVEPEEDLEGNHILH